MSIYYGRTGFGYGAYMQLLPYDMKMLNKFMRDDNKKELLWNGYDTSYKRSVNGNQPCRFFYNKKATKSKKEKEKRNAKSINPLSESGYVYENRGIERRNINVFEQFPLVENQSQPIRKKPKPISAREKTILRYGKLQIKLLENLMRTKPLADHKCFHLFKNTMHIKFYDKVKLTKKASRIENNLHNIQYIISSGLSVDIKRYFVCNIGLHINHFIANMNRMIVKHKNIVSTIDISLPQQIMVMKNRECPLTLIMISELYFECQTCKMCYDYQSTKDYFLAKPAKCSYCRQSMSTLPLDATKSMNKIYNMLKLKCTYF
jgi:hypothetical protein